jgi:hypothetical protein
MRWILAALLVARTAAAGPAVRCDEAPTAELSVDGLLDDWASKPVARAGADGGAVALRCRWDGEALGLVVEVDDDRVVRVRGAGHEDRVDVKIRAGGSPATIAVSPGTPVARPRITAPRGVAAADALTRTGFVVEARVPAAAIAGLSDSTPALEVEVAFHDADQARGGADRDVALAATIELTDRQALLDDFLKTVKLKRGDVALDVLADVDPDRRGNERVIAGGAVIGVLTDRFAYVTVPVVRPSDVRRVALIPLGRGRLQVISAVVAQRGNGGTRELLMLWTVWSGQLQPLAQIEVKKQQGRNVLESTWKVVQRARGPELWVEPRPAIGWTAATWREEPADDADPIVLPWDATRSGIAYRLVGAELQRQDLPATPARRAR